MYCNIEKTSVATTQKSHCNIRKSSVATSQKTHCNTGETAKKKYKTALDPSPSSSSEGGGIRTPELAGTIATVMSLRSRGGGGGARALTSSGGEK
jgi:hypothetical protein